MKTEVTLLRSNSPQNNYFNSDCHFLCFKINSHFGYFTLQFTPRGIILSNDIFFINWLYSTCSKLSVKSLFFVLNLCSHACPDSSSIYSKGSALQYICSKGSVLQYICSKGSVLQHICSKGSVLQYILIVLEACNCM